MSNLVKSEDEKSAKTKGSRSNKRELKNLEQEILKSPDLSTEEKLQVKYLSYWECPVNCSNFFFFCSCRSWLKSMVNYWMKINLLRPM